MIYDVATKANYRKQSHGYMVSTFRENLSFQKNTLNCKIIIKLIHSPKNKRGRFFLVCMSIPLMYILESIQRFSIIPSLYGNLLVLVGTRGVRCFIQKVMFLSSS